MARVLFLEDEDILVENIPILMKEAGLHVVGTTSIEEALALLKEEEFDAVLLDIMMTPTGDMDEEAVDYGRETGVEVARQMSQIKPETPIVGFTVVTEDLSRLVEQGVIARYELTGRQIIVYLKDFAYEAPLHFTYRLRARFPMRAQTPPSSAYDYYNPGASTVRAPLQVVVNE